MTDQSPGSRLPRSIRGWKRILAAVWVETRSDRSGIIASGVAFRVVLALFPAGALITWLVTRILGQDGPEAIKTLVAEFLPQSATAMVQQAFRGPLAADPAGSGGEATFGAAAPYVGILVMLWSANGGMKALVDALNVVFDRQERRGFLHYQLVTFGLTCGLLVFLVVAVALTLAVPYLLRLLPLGASWTFALSLIRDRSPAAGPPHRRNRRAELGGRR